MKNCVIACMLAMLVLSCHKEELAREKPTGTLKINIGLYISVGEEKENLKSTTAVEDFKVIIYGTDDQEVLVFDKASDMPDEIRLETGSYYVTATSDNNLPAAFNNPYYYGRSAVFAIIPAGKQSVVINCELSNTAVSVIYSDKVKNYFNDYTTTISTASGSLVYNKEETRMGFFQPLTLTIRASLTWLKQDGTPESKTLTGTIPDPQPKKKYEIHVDAAAGEGISMIAINLNDTAVPVEIVNISDEPVEPVTILKAGDLLITEIMYDPTSLADSYGEWFEIYNNTGHTINLQHLVLVKNATERHVVAAGINLGPHAYQVFARTDTAVSGNKYIYGTGITLNNTGAILSVDTYGTDGTDGIEICAVNYGADDFPSASGASLSLDPNSLNAPAESQGTSWCVSASAYNTGDLGTPGSTNDNCN